jgi:hypothetical protein
LDIGWLLIEGRILAVPVDMKDILIDPLFGEAVSAMLPWSMDWRS